MLWIFYFVIFSIFRKISISVELLRRRTEGLFCTVNHKLSEFGFSFVILVSVNSALPSYLSVKADAWCKGKHVCFPFKCRPQVLECGFESWLGHECLGFYCMAFSGAHCQGFSLGTPVSSLPLSVYGFWK